MKIKTKKVKLEEVAEIISGGTPSTTENEYWNGDIPWITPKDLSGYNKKRISRGERNISKLGLKNSSARILPKDSILFTSRAPIGYVAIAETEVTTNQGFKSLVLKEGNDPDFFYYLLKFSKDKIESFASGSTFKEISASVFRQLEFEIPFIEDQKKISKILNALDDKIELNNQMNETLEAMARAIFKEWFIDFGPVRAKAEGRRPFGMDDETAALFPDSFEESELGMIPKGWRVVDLDSIAEILNGFAFKSEDYREEGVFVLRTKNFSDQGFAEHLSDDVFLAQEKAEEFNSYFVQPFDIHLVMVAASIGKTSITPPCILPALRNQNMWCFRNRNNFPYRHVLNLIVPIVTRELKGFSSGSARDFFRKGDFQHFKIVIPTDDILVKLENHSKIIYDLIASNIEENMSLTQARDLLLPKLISGEIVLE